MEVERLNREADKVQKTLKEEFTKVSSIWSLEVEKKEEVHRKLSTTQSKVEEDLRQQAEQGEEAHQRERSQVR